VTGAAAPAVTRLEAEGWPEAARVLSRAFRENPLTVAVMGGAREERERRNVAGMRAVLEASAPHGAVLQIADPADRGQRAGHCAGVLVATAPGAFPLPPPPLRAQLRAVLAQGLRVALRWRRVFEDLSRHHPPEPHWYLGLLGVDPHHQGRGFGRALLAAWLRGVDEGAGAAWLETDREQNVRFYSAAGFSVRGRLDVFGAPVWLMHRPPAASAAVSPAPDLR